MRILTGVHQIEAETAAGRLRAGGIAARVERDNEALLGVAGSSSLGTFSVVIRDSDDAEARRALGIRPSRMGPTRAGELAPMSAGVILFAVVVLAFLLVAAYAWSLVGR